MKALAMASETYLVLDTGALVAIERGEGAMRALLAKAIDKNVHFAIPVGVLAQAWRGGNRQEILAAFLKTSRVQIVSMDRELGLAAGVLCGRTGTSDVVDATVVLVARRLRAVIITGDPKDLRTLDPKAALIELTRRTR
jgi:predicted nucleic acid-binding protein